MHLYAYMIKYLDMLDLYNFNVIRRCDMLNILFSYKMGYLFQSVIEEVVIEAYQNFNLFILTGVFTHANL